MRNRRISVDSVIRNISPRHIVIDLEKLKKSIDRLIYNDGKYREKLAQSIIYELKPEDVVIDLEKLKKSVKCLTYNDEKNRQVSFYRKINDEN